MDEEWFIRVAGKEYGPVDLNALLEWKREGRLLPTNEARAAAAENWTSAATIPGLFAPPPLPEPAASDGRSIFRRRSFGEIITDSLRIYGRAFAPFLCLTLLVAIPSVALQFIPAAIDRNGQPQPGFTRNASIAAVALTALLICWPIFLAGTQLVAAATLEGRRVTIREALRRAVNYWPRFAKLSLIVYGSYLFWTLIPIAVLLSLVAQPSIAGLALGLVVGAIQVFMIARLWVNFLFWQQSASIGGLETLDALRESRELARSRTRLRAFVRPAWRGAFLASLWFLVILALSAFVELPHAMEQMNSVMQSGDFAAMLRAANTPHPPDALTIGLSVMTAIIHTLLRPVFGIAFVLLYLDAKADR